MNQRFELHLIFLLNIVSSYVSSQTTYTCSINASCGCSSNSAVITKIVGGESATSQTWGWMASIRYSATGSHFCGGSIISTYHILTAAHCVSSLLSPSSIRVYIGSIYLSVVDQTRSVSKIFVHANYSSETYVNDIAILKLSSALDLDQRGIDTICLPNVSAVILASQEYPTPNTSLIGIGWGYMYEASNSLPDALQQVTVQAIVPTIYIVET
ncbi:hypothetical protein I4U23_024700 [Adineta vaga]|nr:hypothetical protein I4U23_024700 [Adineta vaga]